MSQNSIQAGRGVLGVVIVSEALLWRGNFARVLWMEERRGVVVVHFRLVGQQHNHHPNMQQDLITRTRREGRGEVDRGA